MSVFSPNTEKYGPEKTPYLDIFRAVMFMCNRRKRFCYTTYFNYEKIFSVVYLAIGNAKYEFSLVNTGIARRLIDGGILNNNVLGIAIENNVLNFPELERILRFNKNYTFPYDFSVDEVLFLQPYMMMRPCP